MGDSTAAPREVRRLIPFALLAVLTIASGATAWVSSRTLNSVVGSEGVVVYNVPDLARAASTRPGQIVDGVGCQTQANETVKYHIHIHVALYVDGRMMRLPGGIGITQPPLVEKYPSGKFYDVGLYDCLYWLHTHVADGIIHVEAPAKQSFTLGQFFDVWNQPLGPSRVGPARGAVTVYENGRSLAGNPRNTPLLPGGAIQIDVGTPAVGYRPVSFKVIGGCGEGTTSCSVPKG